MPHFFVHPEIAKASTISTAVYTSPEVFERAKEKIFAKSWQFVGHAGRVAEPGSVWPFFLLENYLDEPLLLAKPAQPISQFPNFPINLISNVCTHRGNLVAGLPCKTSQLRCKYHGRVFDLDGKFKFMPEFQGVENFPTAADDLKKLPIFEWASLLFTSLDPVFSPEIFFQEMMERVGWMPLDQLVFHENLSKTYEVKANWALYCENYLEGFHIPFVHGGLAQSLDFGNYETEIFKFSNLQIGIAKNNVHCIDLPPSSPDFGKNVAGYYFWVFPNMMFNFYPWGLSFNLVEPTGVETCRVKFFVYVFDEKKLGSGAGGDLDTVEMEDEEIVEMVQRGVRSRFYNSGRYSVKHEKGTHHFHRLLAEFLG